MMAEMKIIEMRLHIIYPRKEFFFQVGNCGRCMNSWTNISNYSMRLQLNSVNFVDANLVKCSFNRTIFVMLLHVSSEINFIRFWLTSFTIFA